MQLTPEQINEFVAKAVLESQIGNAVKDSVARVMKDLQATYNNPFDQVIKHHVSAIIETQLRETYKEQIQAQIRDALAKAVTDDFVQKLVQVAIDRVSRYG
jgi:uncharacterized membrane-anchored protein YjiN (DUF445 family)